MSGLLSSSSALPPAVHQGALRGDAAAKCLLALALCHSTVREPVDAPEESSQSSSPDAASAKPNRASIMSCCTPPAPANDDVSIAGGAAGSYFHVFYRDTAVWDLGSGLGV
jgi:hypothetical protein